MNDSPDKNTSKNYDFESIQMQQNSVRQNPYASSYNEDNEEHRTQRSARQHIQEYDIHSSRRKVRRKQSALKFNWGMLLFVLIIAAAVAFSIYQISKKPAAQPEDDYGAPQVGNVSDTGDDSTSPGTENTGSPSDGSDGKELPPTFTVTVSNDTVDDGDLILVNYQYEYGDADSIKVINTYEHRSAPFKVAGTDIDLTQVAFDAFEDMVNGLESDTGCDDMIINSGYRTIADQTDIYDYYLEAKGEEYAKAYVANPGQSEHHTGLACDLSFFLDEGYSEPIGEHSHGSWVTEHCSDYGFIVRYPADKVEYTHIAYEAWHFRYVGPVHASLIRQMGVAYEEYVGFLKDFTFDRPLEYKYSDDEFYMIYYVPADMESGKTEIPITFEAYGDKDRYSISGNNSDGFIVTLRIDELSDDYDDSYLYMFNPIQENVPVDDFVSEEPVQEEAASDEPGQEESDEAQNQEETQPGNAENAEEGW